MRHALRGLFAIACIVLGGCRQAPPSMEAAARAAAPGAVAAQAGRRGVSDVPPQPEVAVVPPAVDRARQAAYRRDMLALADDVAAQGDARALAFAAAVRASALQASTSEGGRPRSSRDGTADRWLDEAERQAPDDVTTLVLSLYLEQFSVSRRQALIARWRRLEPGNLAPVLHASLSESALFDAAGSTTYFDSHFQDATRAVVEILSRTSSPALARMRAGGAPDEQTIEFAIGFIGMTVLPPFQRVSAPCRNEAFVRSRLVECRRIGRVLMNHGDILLAELIGAGMCAVLAETSAENAAAEALKAEDAWISQRAADWAGRDKRAYLKRYIEILLESPRLTEHALYRQLTIEAGYPPQPPAGWKGKHAG